MGYFAQRHILRWWIIVIVMLGTIINYLVRSTLAVAVAAPVFMADLHMDKEIYSWVNSVFQATLMLQPVVGYILDRIGLRTGLTLFAISWGLLTIGHGLVTNWQGLAALRGLLGFVEGTSHTAGLKVVSEWFAARERGLAGGIYNLGASAGIALAAPLVTYAILWWNWRVAFYLAGALALVWVLLWLRYYHAPADHPALTAEERALIEGGQEAHLQDAGGKPPVLSLLGRRSFWGIAIPRFLADPTWGALQFWLPIYLAEAQGFDLKGIALYAILPFIAADLGCLFGPAVVLRLQKRGIDLIDARRWTFTLGATMMIGVAFLGWVTNPYVAVLLLSLAGFAHQTLSVTGITMASDLFRRNELGTVAGMAGTMANLGLMIFNLLIGALVKQIGWSPFFVALAALDLIAAVVIWTLVRRPDGAAERESGIIPFLLGTLMSVGLWLGGGITTLGAAGYVGFGFGVLLVLLGIAIEVRARSQKAATA